MGLPSQFKYHVNTPSKPTESGNCTGWVSTVLDTLGNMAFPDYKGEGKKKVEKERKSLSGSVENA
jgi:hypothetical protein